MLKTNNIQYIGINPVTRSTQYLYQRLDQKIVHTNILPQILKNKNSEGFNIYTILNDFISDRTIEDLVGYNTFGIDLDYFNGSVDDILENSENLLGFKPTIINKTYKGYHLYFNLDTELYALTQSSYETAYDLVNKYLEGDKNMRSTTGILKAIGFADKKDNREDFIITNVYTDTNNIVSQENLIKLGVSITFDLNRVKKGNMKAEKEIEKIQRNNSLYNSIDAYDLIDAVNKDNTLFKDINITVTNDSIDNTSGLKITKNVEGINFINDFSGKNRSGVINFLRNYVLKDQTIEFPLWASFFNVNFGIKINESVDSNRKPIHDIVTQLGITKRNFSLSTEQQLDIDLLNWYNTKLTTIEEQGSLLRITTALNVIAERESLDLSSTVYIKEKDILQVLGISKQHKNQQMIRENLLKLSNLNFLVDIENKETKFKGKKFVRLFELAIGTQVGKETVFEIKRNYNPTKRIWLSETTLTEFSKPTQYAVAVKIQSDISQFNSCTSYTLERLKDELSVKNKADVNIFVKKLVENKIVKSVEVSSTGIIKFERA